MNFPNRIIQDCTNVVHCNQQWHTTFRDGLVLRLSQSCSIPFTSQDPQYSHRRQLPVVRCHDQGFMNIMQYTTNFWFRINTCFIFECALQLWVQTINETSGINTKWGYAMGKGHKHKTSWLQDVPPSTFHLPSSQSVTELPQKSLDHVVRTLPTFVDVHDRYHSWHTLPVAWGPHVKAFV